MLPSSPFSVETVLESITDGFIFVDVNYRIHYWNQRAERLLAVPRDAAIGRSIWDLFPQEVGRTFHQQYERALRDQVKVSFEEYVEQLDRWFEVTAYPSADGLALYFRDVTGRKEQENELLALQQRYQSLFDNAPLPQWIYDAETLRILDVNEAVIWHYGYSRQELLQMTILDLRPEEERAAFRDYIANRTGSESGLGIWRHRRKDGSERLVEVNSTTIQFGDVPARLSTMHDVTEQERAKKLLQKSEQNHRSLFEDAPLAQYICEPPSLRILRVNAAALRQYGYTKEEMLRLTSYDLRPREELAAIDVALNSLLQSTQPYREISRQKKKDGTLITVEIHAVNIQYDDCPCILVSTADITHELSLEEKVTELKLTSQKRILRAQIEAQESERKRLGRELHDNVNQQLTTAKLYLDLARSRSDLQAGLIEKSESVLAGTINEIRALSRSLIPPELLEIGLIQAIGELADSFRAAQQFAISLDLDPLVEQVGSDLKVCLYRAVQEGLTNVSKYAGAREVALSLHIRNGELELLLRDDGRGFDTARKATGLGLGNIRNRMDVYNGSVSISSEPGRGTELRVQVPVQEYFESGSTGPLRVFVAEDNEDDRAFLEAAFERVDPAIQVHFWSDGPSLLDAMHAAGSDELPDLIVLDYNMPLLNGLHMLHSLQLEPRFSGIPKVVYSTSGSNKYREKCLAAMATAYIQKGNSVEEIVENAREMISFAVRK
ncbi:PAS domain S-box protein [Flaviaesturariibacter terrae]